MLEKRKNIFILNKFLQPVSSRRTNKKFLTQTHKKYIVISIFIFFWIIALLNEDNSVLWLFLSQWLSFIFWSYYKWIFPPVVLLLSAILIKEKWNKMDTTKWFWLILYFVSISTIIWFFEADYIAQLNFYSYLEPVLGRIATLLAFIFGLLTSLVILFSFSPVNFVNKAFSIPQKIWEIKDTFVWDWIKINKNKKAEAKIDKEKEKLELMRLKLEEEKKELEWKKIKQTTIEEIPKKAKKILIEQKQEWEKWLWIFSKRNDNKKEVEINTPNNKEFSNWQLPDLTLLDSPKQVQVLDKAEIRKKEIEIEDKLLQFKIEVNMEWYQVWPTVIQYRLKPKQWVKLQRIENLKKDLALALQAKSLRIQAPIPWLWVVGIEVPNPQRQAVYIKELLSSSEFNNKKLKIPIAVGKNVSGQNIVWDLTKMPHLLVAGQTASGKSVWMNWFIMSMLYKFSPSELKMIMIDPKRVELSVYNWIPHLLSPVITNADKALNSLKWSVAEMLRRYDLATKVNARNLEEFNEKVKKEEKLPYIVIIIDELADLMMSWNKKEVESSIVRLAQMARAVGMHLVLATQRPSVDVITWLIKANIPSRIAFTVASQVDSRTVIDKAWAEDLLGRWDMLYAPTWTTEPERVQWVLIETHEIERVVNQLKLTIDPDLLSNLQIPEITNGKSNLKGSVMENYKWEQDEDPEIIEKAIEIVKESKKGSTSLIQRKLWLGYARAAKVLDILEELWVVGPANWSKPREVYVE